MNPMLLYGGNRVTKYPDKVEVKNTFTGRPMTRRKPKSSTSMVVTKRVKMTIDEDKGEVNTNE